MFRQWGKRCVKAYVTLDKMGWEKKITPKRNVAAWTATLAGTINAVNNKGTSAPAMRKRAVHCGNGGTGSSALPVAACQPRRGCAQAAL